MNGLECISALKSVEGYVAAGLTPRT